MLSHDTSKSLIIESHLCIKCLQCVLHLLKFDFHVVFQVTNILEHLVKMLKLHIDFVELGVVFADLSLDMVNSLLQLSMSFRLLRKS